MTYHKISVNEVKTLLKSENLIKIETRNKAEKYAEIAKILKQTAYKKETKKNKGIIKKFIKKVSGYSDSQLKRLISAHKKNQLEWKVWTPQNHQKKYKKEDIRKLHKIDEVHEKLSGIATKKIIEREFEIYKKSEYKILSNISVSQLYRLRKSITYERLGTRFTKTQYAKNSLGERRKPNPYNQPGFLRVDTVHQGDYKGQKGMYWINIVDEVTQFEFIFPVPEINHKYVLPVLEKLTKICPFKVINFHSDNGSEFINKLVSSFLNKSQISQTKSRPRRHNDNALIESKNGTIIRKHIGYFHIPATEKNAEILEKYCVNWFIPYLNFHRPCLFPSKKLDKKGKEKIVYKFKNTQTPFEKLKTIPDWEKFLNPEFSAKYLQDFSQKYSDTEFVILRNKYKNILFSQLILL